MVLVKNKSPPFIPLVLSVFYALFRVAMNIVRIITSSKDLGKLASSRFVPQSFCCALFAVSCAAFARVRFYSAYAACDPPDPVRIFPVFVAETGFAALFTISSSTFSRLAFFVASLARFPYYLRIRNGFVYDI